jgi:hypothetical protein
MNSSVRPVTTRRSPHEPAHNRGSSCVLLLCKKALAKASNRATTIRTIPTIIFMREDPLLFSPSQRGSPKGSLRSPAQCAPSWSVTPAN